MKQYFISGLLVAGLLAPCVANAVLDPFSVYTKNAPENCVDKEIGTKQLMLGDLVEIGLCNNPTLNKGFMSVKMAEADYGSAVGEYLPTVTGRGEISAAHSKTQHLSSNNPGPFSGSVALDWLLFDFGGRSASTQLVKDYLDAADFTYNALLKTTVLNISTAYYQLLSSKAVLASAKISEKSFKKSYQESSKRYELGLVPLNDKLLAQTSYEQSKLAVIQAENAVQSNSGNLATILNLPPDTVFDLYEPKETKEIIKLDTDMAVQELMELAVNERDEVKERYATQEATKQAVTVAKSKLLPSVSVGANVSGGDDWKETSPYQYGGSVGLQLNVPIFTGFKNTYAVSKAKIDYQKSGYAIAETVDTVKNEVWTAWQNYNTSVSAFDISTKVLASAKENQRVAFASYEVGRGSILNLLTAESQLSNARQENAAAFYSVLISKANLYRSIGRF